MFMTKSPTVGGALLYDVKNYFTREMERMSMASPDTAAVKKSKRMTLS